MHFACFVVRLCSGCWLGESEEEGNHETRELHEKGPDREKTKACRIPSPFMCFACFVVNFPLGCWVWGCADLADTGTKKT